MATLSRVENSGRLSSRPDASCRRCAHGDTGGGVAVSLGSLSSHWRCVSTGQRPLFPFLSLSFGPGVAHGSVGGCGSLEPNSRCKSFQFAVNTWAKVWVGGRDAGGAHGRWLERSGRGSVSFWGVFLAWYWSNPRRRRD